MSDVAEKLPKALARVLRPEVQQRWMMPMLGQITPHYIEMVLRSAMAGDHVRQWELFDLMEDTWPRLRKNVFELKTAVQNLALKFEPWCEEEEEPSPEADERMRVVSAAMRGMRPYPEQADNGLRDTMFDVLDAWFKGVSVLEIDWEMRKCKGQPIVAPRATWWAHPTYYTYTDGRIELARQNGRSMEFPPDKFIVAIAKTKSGAFAGSALLRPLAWWWCAANFSAEWLLNLAQVFGLPFRWANYDPNAPQATIDSICSMLQNMGSTSWAAFPAGTTLEMKAEGLRNGADTPQGDMLDRADKQCDLLVLGQTLTSDTGGMGAGGGSLALGKVHEGVKAEIIQAAAEFVGDVLSQQLAPMILRLNFGDDSECPSIQLASEQEEDLMAKASMLKTLKEAGAGSIIGLDWLGKMFGIPKPQEGEATLEDKSVAEPQPEPEPEKDPKDEAAYAAFMAGEAAGHPFRGNQWTKGIHITIEDEDWMGTPKEMHKRADAIMRTFQPVEHPEIGKVAFSKQGRNKTLYEKRTPHEFQSVQALPELVKKGKVVGEDIERKGREGIKKYYYLEAGLRIGSTTYRVEMTLRVVDAGNAEMTQFYLHRLKDEHTPKKKSATRPYSAMTPSKRHHSGTSGNSNVPFLGRNVNPALNRLSAVSAIKNDEEFLTALEAVLGGCK